MDHEYEADLLTLLDDEGQEHEFEIIDELENDDGHFLALVPTQQEPDEIASDAETYYIFEVIEEDGEEQLQEVEDDELLDKLHHLELHTTTYIVFEDTGELPAFPPEAVK